MAAAVASAITSGQTSSCDTTSGRGNAIATASAERTSPDIRAEGSSMRTTIRTGRRRDKPPDYLLPDPDRLDHDVLHGHVAHRRAVGAGLRAGLHVLDL